MSLIFEASWNYLKKRNKFYKFKHVSYSTDVTFKQCNIHNCKIEERNVYYSGKQTIYGLKVEVSVIPNRFSVL